jgi:Spy/CpxP family protein refolding chaperone
MEGKAILAMMVTVGLLGGAAVMAQQGPDGKKGGGPWGRGDRMAEYLGLSAEQKTSLEALRQEERTQTEPLRAEGREVHQALRTLMDQDNPDPAALGAAMLAVKQHGAKMKASHDAFEAKLKASLTPEQKQKFDAFQAARQSGPGRGGHHGFAGRHPMPPDGGGSPEPFQP